MGLVCVSAIMGRSIVRPKPAMSIKQHGMDAPPLLTFRHQPGALPDPLVLDEFADDGGLEDALPVHVEARHGPVRIDVLCDWLVVQVSVVRSGRTVNLINRQ